MRIKCEKGSVCGSPNCKIEEYTTERGSIGVNNLLTCGIIQKIIEIYADET